MKFRELRGNLADSLQTVVEMDTKGQLIEHIEHLYRYIHHGYDFAKIGVVPYYMRPDPRCGWARTYIVLHPDLGPVGFTDGMPAA